MIDQLIGAAGLYAAGMTILHSFWQATLLALMLWLISRRPHLPAVTRYWTGMALLALQVVLSVLTLAHYLSPEPGSVSGMVAQTAAPVVAHFSVPASGGVSVWSIDFWLTLLVASWAASMVAGTVRLGWSYGQLRRLATTAEPVTAAGAYAGFYADVRQLARRLGYHGPLRLGISDRINGPMLVGHLKPVLLFPLALVNDLTTEEAETVILHELAHLRRYDHLLHPLQCGVEILYYYHPAIHWISERIREERENCCDDLVLLYGPGRLPYARALLYFSEHPPATAALSLTDGGGLLARVRRFIDHQEIKYTMNSRLLLLPLLALLALVTTAAYVPTAETAAAEPGLTALSPAPALADPDTLPPGDHQVTKISNGKTTRLRVADGEIKELELEGRTVPPEEFDAYEETAEELLGLKEAPRHRILHRDSFFRLAPRPGVHMDSVNIYKALAKVRDLDYGEFEFDFGELAEHMDSLSGEIARMYHFDAEGMEGGFRWEGFDFDSIHMPHLSDMPMFRPYLRELDELDLEELEARERELKDALRELEKRREKLSGEEGEIRGEALHLFPDAAPEGFMDRSIAHRKAAAREAREQFLAEGRRIRGQSVNRGTDCPESMAGALADGADSDPRVVVEIEREVRRVVRPCCAS